MWNTSPRVQAERDAERIHERNALLGDIASLKAVKEGLHDQIEQMHRGRRLAWSGATTDAFVDAADEIEATIHDHIDDAIGHLENQLEDIGCPVEEAEQQSLEAWGGWVTR